jgi:DNA repair protein RecO (recombination protein O)
MRSFRTDAIVIKRKNVGESDKIVTFLTKKFGKISVKATGVRKITSKRSPHIEPLNLTTIAFYKGKGMPVLTEAENKNSFSKIKNNLKKVAYAYYVCELVDSLCPQEQEMERVFLLMENVLKKITDDLDVLKLIKEFEIDILSTLGFLDINGNKQELDMSILVEQIIERKLKTKQILPRLI